MLQRDNMTASMREIYLDMNVMIDYFENRNPKIVSKINELKGRQVRFPYSPAHIEEIANIARNPNIKSPEIGQQYMDKNLRGISYVSGNLEYLPRTDGIILSKEDPLVCLKRVVKDFNGTLYVEQVQKSRLENKDNFGTRIDKVSEISPKLLFSDQRVSKQFEEYCNKYKYNKYEFKYYKEKFHNNEAIIQILFDFIEVIGFHEDSPEKYRSNVHDNTHIMYASTADIFVTGDAKTKAKALAIYSYLDIGTRVLDRVELLNLD